VKFFPPHRKERRLPSPQELSQQRTWIELEATIGTTLMHNHCFLPHLNWNWMVVDYPSMGEKHIMTLLLIQCGWYRPYLVEASALCYSREWTFWYHLDVFSVPFFSPPNQPCFNSIQIRWK
jgi:hypothetical protein